MQNMSRKLNNQSVLVLVGPTASGKSSLAIEMARQYNGEIISADSRQIYRGMDIGTGKVTVEEQRLEKHHLIDICEPNEDYNVTDFKRDAQASIQAIRRRGGLPIICGGTGFWIQALVDNQSFPTVPPNPQLRKKLSHVSCEELFSRLKILDPKRAETIDRQNPFRLIRALEIVQALGKVPSMQKELTQDTEYFIVAINPPKAMLDTKIQKRLNERLDQGMIEEVQNLQSQGISFEKLEGFGLEYRWISLFLQKKIDEQSMREKLYFDIIHYAKRQRTWLHRWEKQGADIHWITASTEMDELIHSFLKN